MNFENRDKPERDLGELSFGPEQRESLIVQKLLGAPDEPSAARPTEKLPNLEELTVSLKAFGDLRDNLLREGSFRSWLAAETYETLKGLREQLLPALAPAALTYFGREVSGHEGLDLSSDELRFPLRLPGSFVSGFRSKDFYADVRSYLERNKDRNEMEEQKLQLLPRLEVEFGWQLLLSGITRPSALCHLKQQLESGDIAGAKETLEFLGR